MPVFLSELIFVFWLWLDRRRTFSSSSCLLVIHLSALTVNETIPSIWTETLKCRVVQRCHVEKETSMKWYVSMRNSSGWAAALRSPAPWRMKTRFRWLLYLRSLHRGLTLLARIHLTAHAKNVQVGTEEMEKPWFPSGCVQILASLHIHHQRRHWTPQGGLCWANSVLTTSSTPEWDSNTHTHTYPHKALANKSVCLRLVS